MALAAYPLGIECRFVDTQVDSPGGQVGPIRVAPLDDIGALRLLAAEVDVVTFDIENVSIAALREVESIVPVHPSPDLVAAAQDRLSEKQLFQSLAIPTAAFVPVESEADLAECDSVGWPIVLKARRLGYDGRGQRICHSADDLVSGWIELGRVPAIAEAWVPYERELSLIGVRGANNESAYYCLTENVHSDGILRSSIAPFNSQSLQRQGEEWLDQLMRKYDYRGVLTVEFFATASGLIANEMAPRVHNSGHWTIEGAATSQFENHIRAILGLPIGNTKAHGHAAMLNLLGELPARGLALSIDGVHWHEYGKSPRPARKLGHCTLVDNDRAELERRFAALKTALGQ